MFLLLVFCIKTAYNEQSDQWKRSRAKITQHLEHKNELDGHREKRCTFSFFLIFFLKSSQNVLVFLAALPLEKFKLNCVYFFLLFDGNVYTKNNSMFSYFFGLLSVDTKRRSGKKCNEGSSLRSVFLRDFYQRGWWWSLSSAAVEASGGEKAHHHEEKLRKCSMFV